MIIDGHYVPDAHGSGSQVWPVDLPPKLRRVNFGHDRGDGERHHAGQDIPADPGTPVLAPENGEIIRIHGFTRRPAFSADTDVMLIQLDSGIVVALGEIEPGSPEAMGLEVGDRVERGQQVATVGGLGMLHFETYSQAVQTSSWPQGTAAAAGPVGSDTLPATRSRGATRDDLRARAVCDAGSAAVFATSTAARSGATAPDDARRHGAGCNITFHRSSVGAAYVVCGNCVSCDENGEAMSSENPAMKITRIKRAPVNLDGAELSDLLGHLDAVRLVEGYELRWRRGQAKMYWHAPSRSLVAFEGVRRPHMKRDPKGGKSCGCVRALDRQAAAKRRNDQDPRLRNMGACRAF